MRKLEKEKKEKTREARHHFEPFGYQWTFLIV
jgi:hypothetical protein